MFEMRNIQRLLSTEKGNSWESTIGMVRVSNNSSSQDLVKQCYNIILVSQQEWPETQSTPPNQMTNNRISQIAPTKTYQPTNIDTNQRQPMFVHLVPWILRQVTLLSAEVVVASCFESATPREPVLGDVNWLPCCRDTNWNDDSEILWPWHEMTMLELATTFSTSTVETTETGKHPKYKMDKKLL